MKFVIAQMKHETNTFSPVPTPLFAFGKDGPYFDRDAFDAMRGTATPMGAFIDRATEFGAEIVPPVAGDSPPSGPVAHEAYTTMCDAIIKAVEQGCDAAQSLEQITFAVIGAFHHHGAVQIEK